MGEIDPELLRSPYTEPQRGRPPLPAVLGIVVLAGIAVVLAMALLTRSGSGADGDAAGSDGATSTTVVSTAVVLAAYDPTPPILTHPRVLPDGWDACSLTDDRFEPDRFCGGDDDRWVEVRYAVPRPTDPEDVVRAGLHDGEWTSETDPLELRFPINEHVALVIRTRGLDKDEVLEVADSIPVIADRADLYGAYELPIDWEAMAEGDLVGLLDEFEDDATVDLGRFELTVQTSNATLHGFNTRGYWTPDAAADLPMARLVEADRPLVVGASTELRKGYAVWDQAGFAWRLEGNLDADEATALALSVITKLTDLPLDVTR